MLFKMLNKVTAERTGSSLIYENYQLFTIVAVVPPHLRSHSLATVIQFDFDEIQLFRFSDKIVGLQHFYKSSFDDRIHSLEAQYIYITT